MGCNSVANESSEFYNLIKKEEALSKYGFDWEKFSKYLGYKKTPDTFVSNNLSYLKCICKILNEEWKTKKWETYWLYIHFRQICRLDMKNRHIPYKFLKEFLQGRIEIVPAPIFTIFGLTNTFNHFLSDEYEKKFLNKQKIDFVRKFSNDLLNTFKKIIRYHTTWLSDKTKKYALLKLKKLKIIVGKPDNLREDPILDYKEDDAYGNMLIIGKWKTEQYINLNGKPVIDIPDFNWRNIRMSGTQCYIVNAFYTPSTNSIYIPLGYIQKPFVDLEERGIEYNLSTIGYTLCHEMCHALDDMGSKYSYDGNLYNWWSNEDLKKYNAIMEDIIEQYKVFAKRDGIDYNASLAIGESIADISAIRICQEYLANFQDRNKDIAPISNLSFQAFFIYYAVIQKQFVNKRAVVNQLITNPHPLSKYRTNIPLSRIGLFRSIYNIKKNDGMWWNNDCSLWDEGCKNVTKNKSIKNKPDTK